MTYLPKNVHANASSIMAPGRSQMRNCSPSSCAQAPRDNVLELAGKLLAQFGGLGGLMRADFIEICSVYGLGSAKTAQLKAALEIGRRLGMIQPDEKYQFQSPADAANLVMMEMAFLHHEQTRILILDTKNQVVENISPYQGTVDRSVLRAAETYRPA